MLNETRTIYLDPDLDLEAYRFKGITQKFPAHFHDYYVFGFIEEGERELICQGEEYVIHPGDVLIFNPYDTHSCEQVDGGTLDYRCINVKADVIKKAMFEIKGEEILPRFKENVLYKSEVASTLKDLHLKILEEEEAFKKEELFLYLMEELIEINSDLAIPKAALESSHKVQTISSFLEEHYTKKISLKELSDLIGWSKYHLLRSFTKQKGISPYSYLETIRVNHAKKLLEQGVKPAEAAFLTGFSDQSHLTKFFKSMIGLTPKQYMKIFESKGEG
ncbi:AraC family transcriptional regulator [Oceanobacillus sp. FSL W8-0428]|uniref:Putative HTH-type transcriptional regulator YbfI n=1 Tax=Oceanobacillus sojae TaxID=582851 RepID=A0A511ZHC8_9BACI|nr:AraC family transcriptional regulator [Oceanobacillus sojae]GEN86848.1 putative HTH-type transcriptional regulator YbfI [Oceanobacillus sojae]